MLDRELQAKHHLPLAWYDVLLELNDGPDRRLRMSELGERVALSRIRVSRLVDELTAAGPVVRQANPDDRRSAYAVLTAKGRTLFRQAAPTYLDGIDEAVRHGSDARRTDHHQGRTGPGAAAPTDRLTHSEHSGFGPRGSTTTARRKSATSVPPVTSGVS